MKHLHPDYIECALWSSNNENGTPLNCGAFTLPIETANQLDTQARTFYLAHETECDQWNELGHNWEHDLWLTRNRHGAGFWDRETSPLSERLTNWAHEAGEVDLYVGDDDNIYVY
jgi:hypothetical protein